MEEKRYGLTVIQTPFDLTQTDSDSQRAEILFRTLTKFKLFQGRTLALLASEGKSGLKTIPIMFPPTTTT